MKKYKVSFLKTPAVLHANIVVTASNEDEAVEKAEEALDDNDWKMTDISHWRKVNGLDIEAIDVVEMPVE